jgi:hypothetical protein
MLYYTELAEPRFESRHSDEQSGDGLMTLSGHGLGQDALEWTAVISSISLASYTVNASLQKTATTEPSPPVSKGIRSQKSRSQVVALNHQQQWGGAQLV